MLFESQALPPFLHGTLSAKSEGEWMIPYRFLCNFTDFVKSYPTYAAASAGIHLAFETDAEQVSLFCKTVQVCDRSIGAYYDIRLDGELAYHFLAEENITQKLQFSLSKPSCVEIWFPINAEIAIQSLHLENATRCRAVSHIKKCLFVGDSITQGFHCENPSMMMASTLSRALDMEVLNQGIGGFSHRKGFLQLQPFVPDLIIVALGTNDPSWPEPAFHDVDGFYEDLNCLYPHIPTAVITPYHRFQPYDKEKMAYITSRISACATARQNCLLIDGKAISMPDEVYFADGLHPNLKGMQYIATQLLNGLKQLPF